MFEFLGLFKKKKPQTDLLEVEEEKEEKEQFTFTDLSSCECRDASDTLDVLVITDTHGKLMRKQAEEGIGMATHDTFPDIIFFLGDVMDDDFGMLEELFSYQTKAGTPVFGISGNHDNKELISQHKFVTPLDGRVQTVTIRGRQYTIGGLSGSIRYKDEPKYVLRSHKESSDILRLMPACDILITHDKACYEKPEDYEADMSLNAHSGLYGIGEYILQKKPSLHLHGHLHDQYIKRLNNTGTVVRCCYYIERFDVRI